MPATGVLLWMRLFSTTVMMKLGICGFVLVGVNLVLTRKLFVIKMILVPPLWRAFIGLWRGTALLTVKTMPVFLS